MMQQLDELRAEMPLQPLWSQPFHVDIAPDGGGGSAARCRGCGFPIAPGEARVGVRLPSARGDFDVPAWHHVRCMAQIHRPFFHAKYFEGAATALDEERLAAAVMKSLLSQSDAKGLPRGRTLAHRKAPSRDTAASVNLYFDTEQQLSRHLAVDAVQLTAALRAITGDATVRLTPAQQREVNHVARRWRLAAASLAPLRRLPAHEAIRQLSAELHANYAYPVRLLPAYLAQLRQRKMGSASNAHVRRGLLRAVTFGRAFGATDQPCPVCRGFLRGRSRGGVACTGALDAFTACGTVVAATSCGRHEWWLPTPEQPVHPRFDSALKQTKGAAKGTTKKKQTLGKRSAGSQKRKTLKGIRSVGIEPAHAVSVGGVTRMPLTVYRGDYVQLRVPLLRPPTADNVTASRVPPPPGGADIMLGINVVLHPSVDTGLRGKIPPTPPSSSSLLPVMPASTASVATEKAVPSLPTALRVLLSSGAARLQPVTALAMVAALAHNETEYLRQRQMATAVHGKASKAIPANEDKQKKEKKKIGAKGHPTAVVAAPTVAVADASPHAQFDFGDPPSWSRSNILLTPSHSPGDFFFAPHAWALIAHTPRRAQQLLERVDSLAARTPSTAHATPSSSFSSSTDTSPASPAPLSLVAPRLPCYRPEWLQLWALLGHRPPFIDEGPVSTLYLLNRPELTRAERTRAAAYRERKQQLLKAKRSAAAGTASSSLNRLDGEEPPTTVTFRGQYPVDPHCPEASSYQVCRGGNGEGQPLSAHLLKTDLRAGKNSFYVLQLLVRAPDRPGDGVRYVVFRRWGRVGRPEQSGQTLSGPFTNYWKAVQLFGEVYFELTGNHSYGLHSENRDATFRKKPHKYFLVSVQSPDLPPDTDANTAPTSSSEPPTTATSDGKASRKKRSEEGRGKTATAGTSIAAVQGPSPVVKTDALHPETRRLLSDLFSLEMLEATMHSMQVDVAKCPLGSLSASVLDRAAQVLRELQPLVVRVDRATEKLYQKHKRITAPSSSPSPPSSSRRRASASSGAQSPPTPLIALADTSSATIAASSADEEQRRRHREHLREHHLRLPLTLERQLLRLSNRFYTLIPHALEPTTATATTTTTTGAGKHRTGRQPRRHPHLIDSVEKLSAAQQRLHDLRDVLATRNIAQVIRDKQAAGAAPVDVCWEQYRSLGVTLTYMGPQEAEAPPATAAAASTHGTTPAGPLRYAEVAEAFSFSVRPPRRWRETEVTGVWAVERPEEAARLAQWLRTHRDPPKATTRPDKEAGHEAGGHTGGRLEKPTGHATASAPDRPVRRLLLWHGSAFPNWVRICRDGLRIAPADVIHTGHMFGKGVYFGDLSAKAMSYSCVYRASPLRHHRHGGHSTDGEQRPRFDHLMALAEVAVGAEPTACYEATPQVAHAPTSHATLGVGRLWPAETRPVVVEGGSTLLLPSGDVVPLMDCSRDGMPRTLVRDIQRWEAREAAAAARAREKKKGAATSTAASTGGAWPPRKPFDDRLRLLRNEYVVYHPDQIRLRYLVAFCEKDS